MHMHSKQYKEPSVLEGKRVLVVGGGNSACDIVAEAARFARSAHVSHRRGTERENEKCVRVFSVCLLCVLIVCAFVCDFVCVV